MSESKIVTLASGPRSARRNDAAPAQFRDLSAGDLAPAQFRNLSGVRITFPTRSRRPSASVQVLAYHALAACADKLERDLAPAAMERLACIALARKLGDESPIGPGERRRMLRNAGVPGVLYANPATEAIFSSSAESLGKGGVIGSIGKAISNVANSTVGKEVGKVAEVVFPVQYVATKLGSAVLNKVPSLINGIVDMGTGAINSVTPSQVVSAGAALLSGGASGLTSGGISGLEGGFGDGGGTETNVEEAPPVASTPIDWSAYAPYLLAGGGVLAVVYIFSGRKKRR